MRTPILKRYEPRALDGGGYEVLKHELPPCSKETALLWGFRWATDPLQKEYFFWRIADIWWNSGDSQKMSKHHWSERIIRECCRNRYLGVGGAASSGKSYVLAAWALVYWMAAPAQTKVMLTSTHLAGARDRIWGAVIQLIDDIPAPPCRIVDSIGLIAYCDPETGTSYATFGLKLVSADKKQGTRRIGKIIGGKAPRVLLVADELGEISESVQEAFSSNIGTNPESQMVGLSNPASRFDPFGVFCTPKGGWEKVDVLNDMEWTMQVGGKYIRLDAYDSPNFSLSDEDGEGYPYLPSERTINEALASLGSTPEEASKSNGFLRMFRAVFNDSDNGETVYSIAEITKSGGLSGVDIHNGVKLAGLDPSFSSGGDATVLKFGDLGYDDSGQHALKFGEAVRIYEDSTNKLEPRNMQIARKVVEECKRRGVKPENLSVDATGAGGPFCDILQMAWDSNDFLRVQFGGAASDRRIKNDSKTVCRDRYHNMASELFFIGKQFLLGRQLFGLSNEMVRQMTSRLFKTHKGVKGLRMQVEPKPDYKRRMSESPDETDASFVLLEVARSRHFFLPQDPVTGVKKDANLSDPMKPFSLRSFNKQHRSMADLDGSSIGYQPHLD